MNTEKTILGIDVGTQGIKIGFFDLKGKKKAFSYYPLEFPTSQNGYFSQKPEIWLFGIKKALANSFLDEIKKKTIAIGITATSATVIFCEGNGRPLIPAIMWMDCRAKDEARLITEKKDRSLRYVCNQEPAEFFWPKVFWIERNLPEIFQRSRKIVDAVDWLIYQLTGRWSFSYGNAVVKANYLDGYGWPEFVESRFLKKLPEKILYPYEIGGYLLPEIAKKFGLPSGIPIISATIDGYATIVGLESKEDEIIVSMGTSWSQFAFSKQPKFLEKVWGPFRPFLGIPDFDFYVYETGQIIPGQMISDFIKYFRIENISKAEKEARKAKRIPLLKIKWGNRHPTEFDFQKNILPFYPSYKISEIFRAILEEIALGCAINIKNLLVAKENKNEIRVRLCGGGAKSKFWQRILEEKIGLPVVNTKEKNVAVKGAANWAKIVIKGIN